MTDTGASVEATIGELVELEEELTRPGTGVGGTYEQGTIAGVSKIAATEVPGGYPVPIDTTYALHVEVETEGGTVPIFLEWPGEGEQTDHVAQLLDALDRDPAEFAGIYGDRVGLEAEDGWHGVDVERTRRLQGPSAIEESDSLKRTRYAVTAAVAVGIVPYLLMEGDPSAFGGLLLLLSWIGIPASMYLDLQNAREAFGWDTDTWKWIVPGAIPVIDVVVGGVYLLDRYVQTRGVEGRSTSDVWYKAVLASIPLPIVALPLGGVHVGIGGLLLVTSLVLLPVAIHFDAEYVREATDWDPNETLWVVAAVVAMAVALWWVVGIAYVLVRYSNVD